MDNQPQPVLAGDELKPGTHINAFIQDVEDARKAVDVAIGNLQNAEAKLEAHPDYVKPDTSNVPDEEASSDSEPEAPAEPETPAEPEEPAPSEEASSDTNEEAQGA